MDEEKRMERTAHTLSPFAAALKIRTVSYSKDEVVAELTAEPWLANRNGVLHGGVLMSLADNVCGTATYLNRPEGTQSVTLECKTNFLRRIRIGDVARATVTPYHIGRTTMIWEVKITRGDGKLVGVVTQTQLVLDWKDEASGEEPEKE